MALPKPTTPVYELTIPSTNKKVKYRPFLVREEKALLHAQNTGDSSIMVNTLKSVIENCVLSKIDVEDLALFDVEYIFCKLRAKSVGEIIDLNLICGSCQGQTPMKLDISKVEVEKSERHQKKFVLFDKVGVSMKYPSYDLLDKLNSLTKTEMEDLDTTFDIIIESIDFIYNEEEVFYAKDSSREELLDFVNNLTKEQLEKVSSFFETMPKLTKRVEFKCPHCQHENILVLEGLSTFFQ